MSQDAQKYITPHDLAPGELNSFFLACEIRPGAPGFSPIDGFAYDVVPAYIRGTMGQLHYEPDAYAVIDLHPEGDHIVGYKFTVSHQDTVALLDRMKGHYGPDGFNMHVRVRAECWTTTDQPPTPAWVYLLDTPVVNAYESMQQVEYGMWTDDDDKLTALLDDILAPPDGQEEGEGEGEEGESAS